MICKRKNILTTFKLQVVKKIYYFCSMAKQKRRSDCPISTALDIFGDKWTLLIIRDLLFKCKQHYVEFLQSEEKIATNILADRLHILEQHGIISKSVDPAHGSRYLYHLSMKGADLLPMLIEMILWSAKYDPATAADAGFIAAARQDLDGLLKKIKLGLKEKISV